MPRSTYLDLDRFDSKIEKTLRIIRKKKEVANSLMANQQNIGDKVLRDHAMPSIDGATSSIQRPFIQTRQFEINPAIIQMIHNIDRIQMIHNGLSHEDHNWHIVNLLEIYDTYK